MNIKFQGILVTHHLSFDSVMDSDGETVYRVPQFNMVAHGAGQVSDGADDGQITSWVSEKVYKIIYSKY